MSLDAQDFRESIEIVVVDDGSTEPVVVKSSRHPLRCLRREVSQGRNSARNFGWRSAEAERIVFLDDDDRLTSDAIRLMVQASVDAPDAAAVASGRRYFGDRTGTAPWVHRRSTRMVLWDAFYGVPIGGPGVLFARRILETCDGLIEGLEVGEDWAGAIRIAAQGPVVLLPEPLMEVRVWGTHRWASKHSEFAKALSAVPLEAQRWTPVSERARLHATLAAFPEVRAMFDASWKHAPMLAVLSLAQALRSDPLLATASLFWQVHGPSLAKTAVRSMLPWLW
jgi:GT2 family glycosyltransferase